MSDQYPHFAHELPRPFPHTFTSLAMREALPVLDERAALQFCHGLS
jgi:hypothetical protein